jgi:hypothetical protein
MTFQAFSYSPWEMWRIYNAAFVSIGQASRQGGVGDMPHVPVGQDLAFLPTVYISCLANADTLQAYTYGLTQQAVDLTVHDTHGEYHEENPEEDIWPTVAHNIKLLSNFGIIAYGEGWRMEPISSRVT